MSDCGCPVCRNPAGDTDIKDRHAISHREFEVYLETRTDARTFYAPTSAAILRWTVAEFDAPSACVRHPGAVPHPSHRQ